MTIEDYKQDIDHWLSRLRPFQTHQYGEAIVYDSYTVEYGGQIFRVKSHTEMVEHILKANDYFLKERIRVVLSE